MSPRRQSPEGSNVASSDDGTTASEATGASEVSEDSSGGGPSRRELFGAAGIAAGALAVGGAAGFAAGRATAYPLLQREFSFYGSRQSGILTPQQDRMHFAAFDVTTSDRARLIGLLQRWSAAAAALMAGKELGSGTAGGAPLAPPDDTGEAHDLPPSGLTITIGFGPGLFERDGVDRFGIRDQRPAQLIDLPHFPGDQLDPAFTGGDVCVQACADDPQVAVHAIRNLARLAFGDAAIRWSQLGFGRTSSTTRAQVTPRNFMGFKDGTRNLHAEDTELVDRWLWSQSGDGTDWMADGTYLVSRRIRILIENWDRTSLSEQEALVGRHKSSGAPLSGGEEFTDPDFDARDANGDVLIRTDSHIAISHPNHNGGAMMLRRGYNFTDGADALGRLDAGLFFLAYVRDPRTQFVPLQDQMARFDPMTFDFLRTTGSATWAIPPGIREGRAVGQGGAYVGETLFA